MDALKNNKTLKQLYSRPKKETNFAHFGITQPNVLHEIDILHFSSDNGFRYLLNLIDVYNGLCAGRALKDLNMSSIIHSLDDIYDSEMIPITYPTAIRCDNEFNNAVFKNWCNSHNINLMLTEPNYHRSNPHVERLNASIGSWLWKLQVIKEIETGKPNKQWHGVYRSLYKIINDKRKEQYNLDDNGVKRKNIEQKKVDDKNPIIEIGTHVRLQLEEPEDLFGNKLQGKFRKTDPRWRYSPTYIVKDYITGENQVTMYRIVNNNTKQEFKNLIPYERLQII